MTTGTDTLFDEEAPAATYEHLDLDVMPPNMVRPSFKPLANRDRLWGINAENDETLLTAPRRMAPDLMRLFLANKTPITLWGPIGSRKTRTIESMAMEKDENGTPYQVITIQPSTEDPTVIHGMMYTTKAADGSTIMSRSIPNVAKQIIDYWIKHRGLTILFLDEMTTCMPAQQHALLGLLTHGKYGDIVTEPYTTIAMAANPEGTVSAVNDLGEQVMNRGGHIAWYGDVSLFLEEWGSGFKNPSRAPARKTFWYINELLGLAPADAFRNKDNWQPDSLVPWTLIEHTERSTTELAKMLDLIEKTFGDSDDAIRFRYIVEVTRALMGKDWADRMALVTSMEGDMISGSYVLSRTRGTVRMEMTMDQLTETLPEGLSNAPGGLPLRQDQAQIIMDDLMTEIDVENGRFNVDHYLAAWAFIVLMTSSGAIMSLNPFMVRLSRQAGKAVAGGIMTREAAMPAFVSVDLRNTIRGIAASMTTRGA